MNSEFKDATALITGGSYGIGRAVAVDFAGKGARVTKADLGVKRGKETCGMIKDNGGEAIFVETDVSIAKHVEGTVQ